MSKFVKGDHVRFVDCDEEWSNYTWEMGAYIGKCGTVEDEMVGDHGPQLRVMFEDDYWWIKPEWLELIPLVKEASAIAFLSKASALMQERGQQYDKPQGERSMGVTITAFNTVTGRDLKESEGWLLLQLLKDVRQWQNPDKYHADSAEDCIAYAALKAEALAEGK